MYPTLVTAALCVVVVLYTAVNYVSRNRAQEIEQELVTKRGCEAPAKLDTGPWPFGLHLIAKTFELAKKQRLLPNIEMIITRTGTTFEQTLLGARAIVTVDPINVEALLSKQFTDFDLGERRPVFAPTLGNGIFTQDGSAWQHSRALLRPTFAQNREQGLQEIARAVEEIVESLKHGDIVDLQPLFFRFTFDITCFLLFGCQLEVLEELTGVPAATFAAAFDEAQDYIVSRLRLGPLYWLMDGPRYRRANRLVHNVVDKAVSRARDLSQRDEKSAFSVLDDMLEQTQDPKLLRDQCLHVLLAGRDTTACLLSWTFRLLVRHPPVLATLSDEINEICIAGKAPSRVDLKKMKYLDAVFKEVLRLYPSVPMNARTTAKTTTLPVGGGPDGKSPVLVRKGEPVGFGPYVLHRRKALYGQDAAEFRPERWLENGGRLQTTIGYGYVPFHAGPRLCLGQDFALVEAGYMVVRMLQTFPGIALPKDESTEIGQERQRLTIVLCCAEGCRVALG